MSNQVYYLEKVQYNHRADSGFLSSVSTDYNSKSMQMAQVTPVNNDYVKNLQAEFANINNFDAVRMNTHKFNVTTGFNIICEKNQVAVTKDQHIKRLLKYFEQDDEGDTQLHISVYNSIIKASLWLIANAPNSSLLDIRNDDCLTALHVAVMTKQHEIVRKLVLAGANTNIITLSLYQPWNCRGNAAIHMACEADDLECVKALTDPLNDKDLQWLSENHRVPSVYRLDLEKRNFNGATPMHVAIRRGNLEIVKQLVKVGAQVNTIDPCSGFTSLHYAITRRHRHIVEYMATHYPRCINVPSRFGLCAYEMALDIDKQLAEDLVKWGAERIVHESDSDVSSESESEESSCDESKNYSPSFTACSDIYNKGSVPTTTLIIT